MSDSGVRTTYFVHSAVRDKFWDFFSSEKVSGILFKTSMCYMQVISNVESPQFLAK